MSNIIITIKDKSISIKSDGINDKVIFVDYDINPNVDIRDEDVFTVVKMSEEEENLFKN